MMTISNGSEKSSRSKADYFELLIARSLALYYKVPRDFKTEIDDVKKFILGFRDGNYRIKEQEVNATRTLSSIVEFLVNNKITKVKDVKWIGRLHQTKKTLSDIDIICDDDSIIGLSVKSVRSGTGTQKNLGLDTVKKFLSIDIEADIEDMWDKIRNKLKTVGLSSVAMLAQTKIKEMKREYPIIQKIGYEFGFPIQKKAVEQSVNNFNKLSPNNKSKFLKCIYGITDDMKLINIICQPAKIEVYWNDEYNAIIDGNNLTAEIIKDKSYCIMFNKTPILRVQASFTNGVGISAFCQRAFLYVDGE